jgi:steroid delta-isomerase-like uncharacterized protein
MAGTQEIAAKFAETFNAHDEQAMRNLYADNAEFEAPGDVRLEGPDAIAEYAMSWLHAFPDGRLTVHNQVVAGEWAVDEFTFEGTHEDTLSGPGGDIPATGNRLIGRGIEARRVVDGKIVEDHLYFDQVQVLTQLGLMPQPAAT